jgi:crotonobetainyl-CoA:carnitine CoA-transferase CaiB-like acyl-CoA transferase
MTTTLTPAAGIGDDLYDGFARDFATADRERVRVGAVTARQFGDLAKVTKLSRTFAFLERLLDADFSDHGDLHTHREAIAVLLAPWFARHTVADLAIAFAGTTVRWELLRDPAGQPGVQVLPRVPAYPNRTVSRRYSPGAVTRTMPGSLVQPGM